MLFINSQGEYPRHIGDLQLEHSGWQIGDALPEGWQEVAYASNIPVAGKDAIVYETEPSLIDGVLTQTFAVRAMTAEEIERRDASVTAKAKLIALGLTEVEITSLTRGLVGA